MKTVNRSHPTGSLYSLLTLLILFFFSLTVPAIAQADTPADTSITKPVTVPKDSIISVKNLRTQLDSARINDAIAIKVFTKKNIDSLNTLYVDGIPVQGLTPYKTNDSEKILYFHLNKSVQDILLKFSGTSPFEKTNITVYIGVGGGHNYIANTHFKTYIEVRQNISPLWIWVACVVLLILAGMGLKYNILKDDNNFYYSLGRTQLFYWTLLVLVAYIFICFKTDTVPDLPLSILAILGISVSTTAVSKLVENKNKDEVIIDEKAKSEGFLMDILSDGSSINIQRFQNVAFNIFFGVVFLQKAFSNNIMPDFDQNVLILMGISSAAYAGLKNSEATKEQTKPPVPTGDNPDPAGGGGGAAGGNKPVDQAQPAADPPVDKPDAAGAL